MLKNLLHSIEMAMHWREVAETGEQVLNCFARRIDGANGTRFDCRQRDVEARTCCSISRSEADRLLNQLFCSYFICVASTAMWSSMNLWVAAKDKHIAIDRSRPRVHVCQCAEPNIGTLAQRVRVADHNHIKGLEVSGGFTGPIF